MDYSWKSGCCLWEKIYLCFNRYRTSSNLDNYENKKLIVAKSLLEKVVNFCNIEKFNIIKEFKGSF